MRQYLIIPLIFTLQYSSAQSGTDKVFFVIDKFSDTIAKYKDATLKLHLKNESQFPIVLPPSEDNKKPLSAYPKNTGLDLFYDIIYMDGNKSVKIYKKDKYENNVDIQYFVPYNSYVLEPTKSKDIVCTLDYGPFKKIGTYKIRFGFNASRLNKCYTDIYSDWIIIYVKNPDFMNVE